MRSSNLPASSTPFLVADASIIINLNATNSAKDIVGALPNRMVVTSVVLAELSAGASRGHEDARQLELLIGGGSMGLVELGGMAEEVYASLVDGATGSTLDDGEASTIAYALEIGGIAAIDDHKARRICSERFSGLRIAWSTDLLLHESVAATLGREAQANAIFNALQKARMRVPNEHVDKIVNLIGSERAISCRSLPTVFRRGSRNEP
jgi:predicted nucleic acid-binding protein